MSVVAVVTISFILAGDINTLAPIVTMPFLLTYACIDYSYFALAQTFDIQIRREERFRIQAQSPSYETRRYGATNNFHESNDLDHLFPDRTRHKNLSTPVHTPTHSAQIQNNTQQNNINESVEEIINNSTNVNNEEFSPDGVVFRDGANLTENDSNIVGDDAEPIAPIRPPIHSKTKNWYSGFCNRWASLIGACVKILIMLLVNWVYALTAICTVFVVWFYVGTANPAVKPGLAAEFRFFVWLKSVIFRCFG